MKSLMIVGAGPLQLPAYHCALEMGLRVVAIDRESKAPGFALAHAPFQVDTRDVAGAIRIAREQRIDGVVTLCTDFPLRTVAAVAADRGLPGLTQEVAARATNKGLMREAFQRANAPSPSFFRVYSEGAAREAVRLLGTPAILKPASSSGSRGVFKVVTQEQCGLAYAHASSVEGQGAEVIVEQFVEGPEVSVEAISFSGQHHVIAVTDKLTTGDPYWVELGHSQPSVLPQRNLDAIAECVFAGLDALGVTDSPSHVEVKVAQSGPMLIEIGARLGGDFISTELTWRSTGVNMTRCAIELALGLAPTITRSFQRGAAIRYLTAKPGRVIAISGLERARATAGVELASIYLQVGDVVRAVCSSSDRGGHVIAAGETASAAVASAAAGLAQLKVQVESLTGE